MLIIVCKITKMAQGDVNFVNIILQITKIRDHALQLSSINNCLF
jgi:hypothetical protein